MNDNVEYPVWHFTHNNGVVVAVDAVSGIVLQVSD